MPNTLFFQAYNGAQLWACVNSANIVLSFWSYEPHKVMAALKADPDPLAANLLAGIEVLGGIRTIED